jgi:subtilisin family serine protease
MSLIAASVVAIAGCGFGASPGVSPGAHQAASARGLPPHSYSTHRLVVTYAGSASGTRDTLSSRYGLKPVADLPQIGMGVFTLPDKADRTAVLAAIASVPGVAGVEADAMVRASYVPPNPMSLLGRNGQSYGAFRAELSQAWDLTLGDPSVVVAVVDTGVDLTHPALRDQVVPGRNFVTQVEEGDDEDQPGAIVDVPDRGPMDDGGHGTHVAGIIAAAHTTQGVAGVAPRCRIMPVKSLGYNESGFSSDVANGVVWAVDHGARVINLSLGAYGGSKALERAVAYALAHQVVVTAAMGNDRDDPTKGNGESPSYPAALPGVIAVGATDATDTVDYFSNAGPWISVSAPGGTIHSTTPTYPLRHPIGLGYDDMSGTSMATPFVSGVAALMLSLNPHLGPADVKTRLEQSADDLGVPGFDTLTGHGRINPYRALGARSVQP